MIYDYVQTTVDCPANREYTTGTPVIFDTQWCNKCNEYTPHNTAGCAKCGNGILKESTHE